VPEEDEIRAELMGLLRYANATAVGKALGVSAQTVTNWARGKHPSQTRLTQVRALYGLPVTPRDTTKEPPPEWAGAMESRIISEVVANREALYARLADEAALKALRRAGLLPDEPPDGTLDRPPGGAGPKPRPTG
jgi:transcriptional regulator with XRE-family HTH domain